MLLKHALPMRRARLAGAIVVSLAALGTAGFAMAGHDSAMTTASALAASIPSSPARVGAFYMIKLKIMQVHAPAAGSGDTRTQDTQSTAETVIVRSGETAMIKTDAHGREPAWGMHFRVDPKTGTSSVAFHGDVFTGSEQHVIGRAQLAETAGTPLVIAMSDKSSGTTYRIEALVTATPSPSPPLPPAPPAPPAPPPPLAMADLPAPPAPPAPPPPTARARYARNVVAPLAPLRPAPLAPALAPPPPAPPPPPARDPSSRLSPPAYPAAALAGKIGGDVRLKLLVGTDGLVKHADVVSSHPVGVFDKVSLAAAKQWHLSPPLDAKGHPVMGYMVVPLRFDPSNGVSR